MYNQNKTHILKLKKLFSTSEMQLNFLCLKSIIRELKCHLLL